MNSLRHRFEPRGTVLCMVTTAGETKIAVIKAIRAVLNLPLKEAKDMTEGIYFTVSGPKVRDLRDAVRACGGTVVLK